MDVQRRATARRSLPAKSVPKRPAGMQTMGTRLYGEIAQAIQRIVQTQPPRN